MMLTWNVKIIDKIHMFIYYNSILNKNMIKGRQCVSHPFKWHSKIWKITKNSMCPSFLLKLSQDSIIKGQTFGASIAV